MAKRCVQRKRKASDLLAGFLLLLADGLMKFRLQRFGSRLAECLFQKAARLSALGADKAFGFNFS